MRNIRFRAWDNTADVMVYKFTIGSVTDIEDELWTCPTILSIPTWSKTGEEQWTCADQLEIMQYTGLFDKDGSEICEGDIIYNKNDEYAGTVRFERGSFAVDSGQHDKDGTYHYFDGPLFDIKEIDMKYFRIIGNAYENQGVDYYEL